MINCIRCTIGLSQLLKRKAEMLTRLQAKRRRTTDTKVPSASLSTCGQQAGGVTATTDSRPEAPRSDSSPPVGDEPGDRGQDAALSAQLAVLHQAFMTALQALTNKGATTPGQLAADGSRGAGGGRGEDVLDLSLSANPGSLGGGADRQQLVQLISQALQQVTSRTKAPDGPSVSQTAAASAAGRDQTGDRAPHHAHQAAKQDLSAFLKLSPYAHHGHGHSAYTWRQAPLNEPPLPARSERNERTPQAAHSQPLFQPAGSLIVPATPTARQRQDAGHAAVRQAGQQLPITRERQRSTERGHEGNGRQRQVKEVEEKGHRLVAQHLMGQGVMEGRPDTVTSYPAALEGRSGGPVTAAHNTQAAPASLPSPVVEMISTQAPAASTGDTVRRHGATSSRMAMLLSQPVDGAAVSQHQHQHRTDQAPASHIHSGQRVATQIDGHPSQTGRTPVIGVAPGSSRCVPSDSQVLRNPVEEGAVPLHSRNSNEERRAASAPTRDSVEEGPSQAHARHSVDERTASLHTRKSVEETPGQRHVHRMLAAGSRHHHNAGMPHVSHTQQDRLQQHPATVTLQRPHAAPFLPLHQHQQQQAQQQHHHPLQRATQHAPQSLPPPSSSSTSSSQEVRGGAGLPASSSQVLVAPPLPLHALVPPGAGHSAVPGAGHPGVQRANHQSIQGVPRSGQAGPHYSGAPGGHHPGSGGSGQTPEWPSRQSTLPVSGSGQGAPAAHLPSQSAPFYRSPAVAGVGAPLLTMGQQPRPPLPSPGDNQDRDPQVRVLLVPLHSSLRLVYLLPYSPLLRCVYLFVRSPPLGCVYSLFRSTPSLGLSLFLFPSSTIDL